MDYLKVEISPHIYLDIIKSLRNIGEIDLSLATCRKGLKRFSQDAGLCNIEGELHLVKFNKNKDSEDLKSALRSFERALIIDPHNYLASIYSSKIYLRVGVLKKAREGIESILKDTPFDVEAQRLKRELKRKEELRNREMLEKLKRHTMPDSKEVDVSAGESLNYKQLTDNLIIFNKLEDMIALFLIDQYGTTVKKINHSSIDEKLLQAVAVNIFRSSQAGLNKIGIGNFKTGMLMASLGYIYIINISGAVVLLLTSHDSNQKKIDEAINEYLDTIE